MSFGTPATPFSLAKRSNPPSYVATSGLSQTDLQTTCTRGDVDNRGTSSSSPVQAYERRPKSLAVAKIWTGSVLHLKVRESPSTFSQNWRPLAMPGSKSSVFASARRETMAMNFNGSSWMSKELVTRSLTSLIRERYESGRSVKGRETERAPDYYTFHESLHRSSPGSEQKSCASVPQMLNAFTQRA